MSWSNQLMTRMSRFARPAAVVCALLFLSILPSTLFAQAPAREGDLYVPPLMTVRVSTDDMAFTRWLNYQGSVEFEGVEVFRIDRTARAQWTLLLPMIFFDHASASIPERYVTLHRTRDVADYTDDAIVESGPNQLAKYYEILNILGFRMARDSAATIALEGSYSTEPGENADLGEERALVVKEYLERVWRIAPERIAVAPAVRGCDSADHLFLQEEARAVRIITTQPQLLDPIRHDISYPSPSHATLRIDIDPKAESTEIVEIEVTVASGDDLLARTTLPHASLSPPYSWHALWVLPRAPEDLTEGLSFQTVMRMADGTVRASEPIRVPIVVATMAQSMPPVQYHSGGPVLLPPLGFYFFTASQTLPDERQIVLFDRLVDLFLHREGDTSRVLWPTSDSGLTSIRSLYVYGEEGESPDVDPAAIAVAKGLHRPANLIWRSYLDDPSFQTAFYVLPAEERGIVREQRRDSLEIVEILETIQGSIRDDLLAREEEMLTTMPRTRSASSQNRIDSMLTARGDGVADVLRAAGRFGRGDSLIVQLGGTSGPSIALLYLPEQRFYRRCVEIGIRPLWVSEE